MPALGAEAERAPEWGQQSSMPFGVRGGLRPRHFGLAKGRSLLVSLRSRVERGLRSGRLGRPVLGRLRGKVGWLWGCGWSRGWRGVDELTCTALLAPLPPVRPPVTGAGPFGQQWTVPGWGSAAGAVAGLLWLSCVHQGLWEWGGEGSLCVCLRTRYRSGWTQLACLRAARPVTQGLHLARDCFFKTWEKSRLREPLGRRCGAEVTSGKVTGAGDLVTPWKVCCGLGRCTHVPAHPGGRWRAETR